ncbi:cytochrome P450 [Pseudonocardia spinosispora]|uniref:cytochrome P450 n=1 Tax=Pseudonocardia spinosispora TaxID=103441 RepID=UPI001B7F9B33|nr:cytochrome P450 [Pseudonocardia spinosispora]
MSSLGVRDVGLDLFDPATVEDPYPFFETLRREAPVRRIPGTNTFLVSSWALVAEAARRTEDFSSHLTSLVVLRDGAAGEFPMGADESAVHVLATADEPDHAAHRKLVLPSLVARRIQSMRSEVGQQVEQLWRDGLVGDRIDWARHMSDRLPLTVVATLIGLPAEDVPQLLTWAYDSTELLGGVVPAQRLEQLMASTVELVGYLTDQYRAACATPPDDLIGDLARASAHGAISDEVAILMLVQLVAAGGESTAGLIANGARLLATHPAVQDQLRADPTRIGAFLEEALRLESPFRGHYRHVRAETTLGGATLPAGSHILLLWGSANRDADTFERPDDLILDRPNLRSHLAFGRGAHFCVGANLARMEATVALSTLLAQSATVTLAPDTAPVRTPSIFVRRHDTLVLEIAR